MNGLNSIINNQIYQKIEANNELEENEDLIENRNSSFEFMDSS